MRTRVYYSADMAEACLLADKLGSLYGHPGAFLAVPVSDETCGTLYAVVVKHKRPCVEKLRRVRQWCDGYVLARADARRFQAERSERLARQGQ